MHSTCTRSKHNARAKKKVSKRSGALRNVVNCYAEVPPVLQYMGMYTISVAYLCMFSYVDRYLPVNRLTLLCRSAFLVQEAIRFQKYDWLADNDNRPHGLIGTRPTHSVTFVDNHDTGSTQRHWPFPCMKKLEGYAYVLTHPGIPTVFWEHFFEDSEELKAGIKTLMQLRKRTGIVSSSQISILTAKHDQYVADVQGQQGMVRVKLGPKHEMGDKTPKDDWKQVLKGVDFCVWEKIS
jgi:hypothetical protein